MSRETLPAQSLPVDSLPAPMSSVETPSVEATILHRDPLELLRKLPPGERDFEVFESVVVDGGTTRMAAARFSISQTRVCQLLDRVREWLAEVLPAAAEGEATPAQLALAQRLAADRLDFLYGQALVGWRSSEGEIERTRVSPGGQATTTLTISYGDPRYLNAAARIALLRSKLGNNGACIAGIALAAEQRGDVEEEETDERSALVAAIQAREAAATAETEESPANPPVRACSSPAGSGASAASRGTAIPTVSNFPARRSDELPRRKPSARETFFAPVQPPALGEVAAAVARSMGS